MADAFSVGHIDDNGWMSTWTVRRSHGTQHVESKPGRGIGTHPVARVGADRSTTQSAVRRLSESGRHWAATRADAFHSLGWRTTFT